MRKHLTYIVLLALVFGINEPMAQRKQNDTLNTGVIDVVKPYTPSISDAFKVRETPALEDAVTETKKPIEYNIFSIPVASTFTPAKGQAAVVEKAKPAKLYDNYATLGAGTYTTVPPTVVRTVQGFPMIMAASSPATSTAWVWSPGRASLRRNTMSTTTTAAAAPSP